MSDYGAGGYGFDSYGVHKEAVGGSTATSLSSVVAYGTKEVLGGPTATSLVVVVAFGTKTVRGGSSAVSRTSTNAGGVALNPKYTITITGGGGFSATIRTYRSVITGGGTVRARGFPADVELGSAQSIISGAGTVHGIGSASAQLANRSVVISGNGSILVLVPESARRAVFIHGGGLVLPRHRKSFAPVFLAHNTVSFTSAPHATVWVFDGTQLIKAKIRLFDGTSLLPEMGIQRTSRSAVISGGGRLMPV